MTFDDVLTFVVVHDVPRLAVWGLLMLVAAVTLVALVKSFAAEWARTVGAGWAWLRLRVLLRWRRTSLGAERYARRVMADLDLDVELLVLLGNPRYSDLHGRCCGDRFDTAHWLDDQPLEGGEGGNR
uniref:hypothetical protein n=1 Tax=Paractinoplanes polyasparticus TaxID=2856853 RepID=UPI001C84E8FC|nr:hypothetical protein [Actinoplanes polyasparticus]